MVGYHLERRNPSAAAPFEFTSMIGFAGQLCGPVDHAFPQTVCSCDGVEDAGVPLNHDDTQIWDAIGEIANMIADDFKNKIVGLENRCMLSLPTVITGSDFLASRGMTPMRQDFST